MWIIDGRVNEEEGREKRHFFSLTSYNLDVGLSKARLCRRATTTLA